MSDHVEYHLPDIYRKATRHGICKHINKELWLYQFLYNDNIPVINYLTIVISFLEVYYIIISTYNHSGGLLMMLTCLFLQQHPCSSSWVYALEAKCIQVTQCIPVQNEVRRLSPKPMTTSSWAPRQHDVLWSHLPPTLLGVHGRFMCGGRRSSFTQSLGLWSSLEPWAW